MEYKEFVDRVSKELKYVLPEEYGDASITAQQVDKLQNASYYGIVVKQENSNIGVSMDLRNAYDGMNRGLSYEQVLAEIGTAIEEGFKNRPQINFPKSLDYDYMKDKLMIQVVPTAGNEEMLADIPHVEREDISMVYRFVLGKNENGTVSALVTNKMLDDYGITAEQLHADAMTYAPQRFPASVRNILEVIAGHMDVNAETMSDDPNALYVATCNDGMYGAGCVFYPGFMEQEAERLGGGFYVLPSSVHEMLLMPDRGNPPYEFLKDMVQGINASEVQPEDRLTDNVYHYDADEQIFETAESYDARMQMGMGQQML